MSMVHYSKETWQAVPLWGNQGFYFWTMMLEKKAAECPLDCKEIKPVNLKGNQAWNFIGRTDAEDEIAIILPPDVENWLIGKYPEAGKDWRQEEKGTTGWDGWMASPTPWTWIWASSKKWWGTEEPGVLQSMGLQNVGLDLRTEQSAEWMQEVRREDAENVSWWRVTPTGELWFCSLALQIPHWRVHWAAQGCVF